MTDFIYNPDCSWSDAQEEHWRKHDLESIRYRCLVCNTKWYECADSDIRCPTCYPLIPFELDDDGKPIIPAKDNTHD